MDELQPSGFAISELGLPTYNDLHARCAELEAELAEANGQIASHIATCKAYTDVAVAAEREACARIAERNLAGHTSGQTIAAFIRARAA